MKEQMLTTTKYVRTLQVKAPHLPMYEKQSERSS
jgi:hypothetical protein